MNWIEKLLFPRDIKCIFCGNDIPNFDVKPYCESCEKVLPFNEGNKCLICSEPIDNEAHVCDSCQNNKRFFKKAFCPFVYQGQVRSAILGFKENNQRYKAKPFAKLIVAQILKDKIKFDFVTFVPMTVKKQKQRTFNQSELLAKEIAKLLAVPVLSVLEKLKDDKEQKLLSFKERQTKIKGLYALKDVKLKKTQNVLLVDDVITTCATINYCSRLISQKVDNVYVCALARNKLKQKNE